MTLPFSDFSILKTTRKGKRLVYLDSAATSLKPKCMVNSMVNYYQKYSANIHRGLYRISQEATEEYENARKLVAKFIGANFPQEVVFVRNTTEAINLIALSWGEKNINKGDRIITTVMEHHSNLVPWQQLAKRKGAEIFYVDTDNFGQLKLDQFKKNLNGRTKLFAVSHVSNVLGTINPVKKMTRLAHQAGAKVLIDGAQAVPHLAVNVNDLECDFYAFSGHKMLGPTGIGVLWIKKGIEISPFLMGGGMIKEVSLKRTVFEEMPLKLEAGTPHIAGVIGLGQAVKYLTEFGMEKIRAHELELIKYFLRKLSQQKGVKIYGPNQPSLRVGVFSFSLKKIHPHDLATILGEENIAIRAGHHCCMPLHQKLKVNATARISFYLYNSFEDIDLLIAATNKIRRILI